MLVACVSLACGTNLAGLSLHGLELSQEMCAWDASATAAELLEPGTVVSKLNVLRSAVIGQRREMEWHQAGGQPCLLKFPEKLMVVASARSALLELLLTANRIVQCLDRAMLHHAWGL